MTDQEQQKYLEKELSGHIQLLDDFRKDKAKLSMSTVEKFESHISKIGELSFIFGAAIVPILIATDKPIRDPISLFLALSLYLLNGFVTLWRSKETIEEALDKIPGQGVDLETDIEKAKNTIHKLILFPNNTDYQNDYVITNKLLIEKFTKKMEQTDKVRINFWLDLFLIDFIMATLLLAKGVWPFPLIYYWVSFVFVFLLLIVLVIVSYFRARENIAKRQYDYERLAEVRNTFLEWERKNVFGEK